MPEQKSLLTRVLNTPEDLQSVGTDRTSKQPLRGSLDVTQGNRNLKLHVKARSRLVFVSTKTLRMVLTVLTPMQTDTQPKLFCCFATLEDSSSQIIFMMYP